MRLATFLGPGGGPPTAGVLHGEHIHPLPTGVGVIDVLGGAPVREASEGVPVASVRLLAPVPRPGAIYGIGLNYAEHAAETGAERPAAPIVFMKPPGAAAGPHDPVPVPAVVRRLDYEGELAVVMGAGGRIGGFAVADDVSARDLQGREPQWTRAKGADGFCPFGPWVTTAEEVPDPGDLRLRTWVNGELRQDARTSELIFPVARLVAFISETCTLAPGDLILTGTPAGVGIGMEPRRFLAAGDVVRIEIEGLGAIEHPIAERSPGGR